MKKLIIISFLVIVQMSCSKNDDENLNQQTVNTAKIQELGRKYGVDVSVNPDAAQNKKGLTLNLEQIEEQFKTIAEQRKAYAEESKQIAALNNELEQRKNTAMPDEYLKTLEKYPLVKQQVIEQLGGATNFEKYRVKMMQKSDSIKKIINGTKKPE